MLSTARIAGNQHFLKVMFLFATMGLMTAAAEAAVNANFTFSPPNPVVDQTIQFSDTSTGGPTNWQWDFNNDGITDSTAQNPTWSFPDPGTYPVTLVALIPPADIDAIVRNVVVSSDVNSGNLSFTMSSYSVNENAGTASISVRRTGGSDGAVSVRCITSNGTATAGSDYSATNDLLSWANGDTSNKNCTIPITNDSLDETNETINLSLTNFTGGAGMGTPTNATLTIIDDDPPPGNSGNLSFTTSSYTVNENAGTASIPVRRTGGSSGAVSVRCITSNGTATAGSDYTATNDLLSWANGDTSNKNCTIPITNDSLDETNETINLSLTNFTGGAGMGTPTNATLTIIDDDPPPGNSGNLSFTTSSYTVNESAGTASIPVRRTGGSDGSVSVVCNTSNGSASAGSDYTATSDVLTWTNSDTANKLCTIPINNDSQDELDETINLSLANFTGGAGMGSPTNATLTIIDDDPPPGNFGSLSFTTANYTVNESAGTAPILVRRTGGSDGAVSVRCVSSDGSATAGSDYTATNDLLSWANGDTSNKTCTVPIIDDHIEEDNETVNMTLTNFTGGATPGSPSSAVLTIIDDDEAGQLQFSMSSYTVSEDVGVAEIQVRRVNGSDGFVSARCSTSNGTATAPADYSATSATLNWPDGVTTNQICTVPIIDDLVQEGNETINLALSNFLGGATAGSPTSAILTITANDDFGELSFSMASYAVNENAGTASITVSRSGGSDNAVSVRCDTSDGTANAPDDYTATMDVLNWADGETANKTCTVPIVDDANDEPTETVDLALTNFSPGVLVGSITDATLNINDNDEAGNLGFVMSSYTVNENVGTASVAVRRTDGSDGPVSVQCNTADGTATAPDDYTPQMDTLNWADGDTTNKTCTIPIVDDSNDEPQETVQLSLSDFTGGAGMGVPSAATLNINDNDEAGDLSFSTASYSVDEEDDLVAMIAVQRTGGSDGPVSVQCITSNGSANAGTDYEATADILEWGDGETTDQICTIPIFDDDLQELAETINLSLGSFMGGATPGTQNTALLTIQESDNPGELSFTTAAYFVSEGDGTASITVQRANGANGAVSVECRTSDGSATEPEDYGATVDILIWSDGETSDKTCTVPIVDDPEDEATQTVLLNLANFTDGARQGTQISASLNITDNDEAGELSFSMASFSVDERTGTASIAVRRTGGADGAVSVRCDTADGTATAPADYVATMDILTWTDGDTAGKNCTIPIVNDSTGEADETVVLSLSNSTGGASLGTPNTATLTIIDDDEHGELSFSMANYSFNEGVGVASIAIRRTNGSDGAVSVRCDTANGSATTPEDYAATADVLNWADGDTADKICTVPIVDDPVYGPDETVNLSLSNVAGGASLGTPNTAILTIVDNDVPGVLAFSMASYSVDEGAGTASITVTRTGGSDGPVSVRCNTANGTATTPGDYGATTDELQWANGDTASKTCTVPIVGDTVEEADETVALSLGNSTGGASLGTPNTATLTIVDDDEHGELNFSMASYSVSEDVGVASIAVQRTNGSDGPVSVRCTTADGTAMAPGDYAVTMDILNWADGDSADRTCTVPIVDDPSPDPNETVTLSLNNVNGGASLGTLNTAALTIVDNDSAGVIAFSMAGYSVNEDEGTASIEVERTGGSDGPVSVRCDTADGTATTPEDYSAVMNVLEWAHGDASSKTCTIPIVDDSHEESGETVNLSLVDPTGGAGLGMQDDATLTIEDDDEAGEIGFSTASYTVNEAEGTAMITVLRTGGSDGVVSVRCDTADGTAIAPEDYTTTMETLIWADGETTEKDCPVPIVNDTDDESGETVALSLTNVSGGAALGTSSIATLIINDDDGAGELSFSMDSYSVDENVGNAMITVQRTGGSDGVVSVRCDTADGTAIAPEDYTTTMEILIWADSETTEKNCPVPIVNDTDDEDGETVSLSLTNVSGGAALGTPGIATLTINDDDGTGELSFAMDSYSVDENTGNATVTVQRTGGSDGMVSVRCDTEDGTATAPDDYTATMETLTWVDGDTADKNCTVPIVNDSNEEGDEAIDIALTHFTNAGMGSQTAAVLTINDDDEAGELSFSMTTYTVNESAGTFSVAVQRTGGSDGEVMVDCFTANGSAVEPGDYTATMDTLTWANGDTTDKNCTVPIINDEDDEDDETISLTLDDPTNGADLGLSSATLTINDDETSMLSFTVASFEVDEGVGTATITVQRTGGSNGTVSVRCSTEIDMGDTATEGTDYLATAQVLSWGEGVMGNQTCSVPIFDDATDEPDETISLALSDATGDASLGAQSTATLTLIDNDSPGEISFSMATYEANEGSGTASVTVQRTGGSDGEVSVRCDTADGSATAPDDYTTTMDVLSWTNGDTADKSCTIPIVEDVYDEGGETVALSLSLLTGEASLGVQNTATLTLIDNDNAGTLSFTTTTYVANEAVGIASIAVRRTGGSDGNVNVECQTTAGGTATTGDDFLTSLQTVEWGNGDTADKTCSVPIVDDALDEDDETVSLVLSNPTGNASVGAPSTATLTIIDDDSPGVIAFSMATYKVNEAAGTIGIVVRRTGGADGSVSVRCDSSDGTAAAPDDYETTMDVLSWADGDTADQTCTVPIVSDTDEEGNETVNLSLSNPTGGAILGGQDTATLTINDDDIAGTLSFSNTIHSVDEGASYASIIVVRDGSPSNAASVLCSTADGTATAGDDYLSINQTLNWGPGDVQNKTCTIPIFEDTETELNETVLLSLSAPTGGASLGTPSNATLTITDNDNSGIFAFLMATYTTDEATGTLNVTVERTGGTQGIVSVRCDTFDGTAVAPGDYAAQMTTLTWADGDGANKTCTIPIVDDTQPEGDETFTLELTLPTGGTTLGSPSSSTVTIQGSDDPGALSFTSNTYAVGEGAGVASIRVRRTVGSNGSVSVQCNTSNGTANAGSDYTATADILSWSDGDSFDKFCNVPILDNDGSVEGNETVNLTLTNFMGANMGSPLNATLTIEEDLYSDGFESGDTSGWDNANGDLKVGGVRILSNKDLACGPAQPATFEATGGSIRLKTASDEPFVLMLSSIEGEFVTDVDAGTGQVIEIYGLPLDAYEIGIASEAQGLKVWIVDLQATVPCTVVDLASDGL